MASGTWTVMMMRVMRVKVWPMMVFRPSGCSLVSSLPRGNRDGVFDDFVIVVAAVVVVVCWVMEQWVNHTGMMIDDLHYHGFDYCDCYYFDCVIWLVDVEVEVLTVQRPQSFFWGNVAKIAC